MLQSRLCIEGKRFLVEGKEVWLNGVNTPWYHWDEFGSKFDAVYWDKHYAMLHEAGINTSRVWITCSGDVGIEFEENGFVKGATQQHWEDVEKLFQIAEKNEIYIMATLMSFDHFKDENKNHMKWRALVQNDEAMDSYVQNYVIPFCQKFQKYNSLWSIDLCNEPDWVYENEEAGKIDWKHLCRFFAKSAVAIHENSNIDVTIGFAVVKYNSEKYFGDLGADTYLQSCYNNSKAYMDFYSTHYYEWMAPVYHIPFDRSPQEFGIVTDKPVVLGEFPAMGLPGEQVNSRPMSTTECYVGCRRNGWQGVMAWTSSGIDSCGNMEHILPAAKAICELVEK